MPGLGLLLANPFLRKLAFGAAILAVVTGVSFYQGMVIQKRWYEAAASRAKDQVIANLKADATNNERLNAVLQRQNRESDARFEKTVLEGDACTVFDDDSLSLLNQSLGHKPVPEAVSGVDGRSGQAATP